MMLLEELSQEDKLYHMAAGAAVAVLVVAAMAMASEFGFWIRFIAGILSAYGVGRAKEYVDALSQKPAWPFAYSGKPDKLDITATVLGGDGTRRDPGRAAGVCSLCAVWIGGFNEMG